MTDREYWESDDSEKLWAHIRDMYADFIVYCEQKKSDSNAMPPDISEHTLNSIIKMAWNEDRDDVYKEAVAYAKSAFSDDLDFLHEAEAWIADREGKYAKAIKLMESIEGGKDMAYTALLRMKRYGKNGDTAKASAIGRAIWKTAKENDDADCEFALHLADVSNEISDDRGTLYFIKEALFADPENTEALYRLATLEFDFELFEHCSQTLDHLLDIDPYNIPAWNQQGVVKRILHDEEGALRAFEYSLSAAPDYLPPLAYCGFIKFISREFDDAKELLIKLDNENLRLGNQFDDLVSLSAPFFGFILIKEGKTQEALERFKLGLDNKHDWVSLLGMAYMLTTGKATPKQCGMTMSAIKKTLKKTGDGQYVDLDEITRRRSKSEKRLLNKFIDIVCNPPKPDWDEDEDDDDDFNWNSLIDI